MVFTGTNKALFLAGLRSILRYHRWLGIADYPNQKSLEEFMQFQPTVIGPKGTDLPQDRLKPNTVPAGKMSGANPDATIGLAELAEEIGACQACELHRHRLYPVPGRGPEKARLLVVGDWLTGDQDGVLPPHLLFGIEQDRMLARMLAAIEMPLGEVFITNCVKCAVPASCQPQPGHVQSCLSFLRRQIAVLAPKVICTMGVVATRAILEKPQTLSQLRGKVQTYRPASPGEAIGVIVTYHPSYLLQNPEMKQAAWLDLQLLARCLREKG